MLITLALGSSMPSYQTPHSIANQLPRYPFLTRLYHLLAFRFPFIENQSISKLYPCLYYLF